MSKIPETWWLKWMTRALLSATALLLPLAPTTSAASQLGTSWSKQSDGFDGGASRLIASPDGSLYLVSNDGPVYLSTDNGRTWTQQCSAFDGIDGEIVAGAAADYQDDLFIADASQAVWRSVDSGITWVQRTSNYGGAELKGLTVDSHGVLYIADHSKDIWSSSDAGTSWVRVSSDYGGTGTMPAGIAYDAHTDTLHITDVNKSIYSSTDAGFTWNKETVSYGGSLPDGGITCDNEGRLYIADSKQDIWMSGDGGGTWVQLAAGYGGAAPLAIVAGPHLQLFILDSNGAVWMSKIWTPTGWREPRSIDPVSHPTSP